MRTRGFSLLEVVIAMAFLATAGLALLSLILGSQQLTRTSTDTAAAQTAILAEVERLRALLHAAPDEDFAAVLAADNWGPPGAGGAPTGAARAVTVRMGEEGQLHLRVIVDEAVAEGELGLTQLDFDGDGLTSEGGAIAPAELRACAVRLRLVYRPVSWKPGQRPAVAEYSTLLY